MIDQLWLIPLGFVAGILGSMIGLGGGIIVVPVLTFLGFPPTVAASNSLFAALSNSVASTISYSKQKRIEYSLGLKLGLLAIPGTILGAIISTDVAPDIFKILFGFVLIASSVYIFLRKQVESREKIISKQLIIFTIGASFFAGIISSFFGIGGGIIFVPLMVIGIGIPMKPSVNDRSVRSILDIGMILGAHGGAQNTIKESFIKLNLGYTFNDRWIKKIRIN